MFKYIKICNTKKYTILGVKIMGVITVRLDESLLIRLNSKIAKYQQKKSDFIREAILAKLEDIEDLESFENTKDDQIYSLIEAKKQLGLAD
jgi:metal-responsive CopG/Arc/MetJ family transcriptional regulator